MKSDRADNTVTSQVDPTRTSAPDPASSARVAVDAGAVPKLRDPDRYQVIREHGRGGLGRVFRVHDRELGRDIAIKELLSRGDVSEVRFLREALITARLEHPGIVPVYEAGRWPDGTPFYAMKLVSGRSLRELIAERTTVAERIGLLHHVIAAADAIAYAHDRNIIHRDLKPANVIIGDFGETIVIDWGLAKDLTATDDSGVGRRSTRSEGDDDLTSAGSVLGTPAYMAPEQRRGERVDQRADVFAIGSMLWELCALQKVPPADLEARHRMLRRAGLDRDLATILDKALAPDPTRRYPDAGALAADLKAFKSGARIAARSYSPLEGIAHWGRHHRPLALSIAAVPLVVVAIVGGVRLEAARSRADRVAARFAAAAADALDASRLAAQAHSARDGAFARFDDGNVYGGEAWWAEARRFGDQASARFRDAMAELEAAFLIDPGTARTPMATVLWSYAEHAEADADPDRVRELLRRLETYDPARAAAWSLPGTIVLELDRPGRIEIHAFHPGTGEPTIAGGFDARPVVESTGAHLDAELPAGSYVSVVAMPDGQVVRDPFLLSRGERLERVIAVPPRSATPLDFVFVPAGRFLYGYSASRDEDVVRRFLESQPQHRVETGAFWISRTEVTYGDWLAYLRTLSSAGRNARRPAAGDVVLSETGGRYTLSIEPSSQHVYRATEGHPLEYPGRRVRQRVRWERLPVSGISYADAEAYTTWLARTGRVPGARICSVHEWERAAKGADGRSFPGGDQLRPTDANFDETYGRIPTAYGPDEVGSFPGSDSPFGISDLAGNVWEWTVDQTGAPWYRGGSFYQARGSAISSNANSPADPSQRNVRIGLRVCADPSPSR